MKSMFRKLFLATIVAGLVVSCTNNGKKAQDKMSRTMEELNEDDAVSVIDNSAINYKIPSPLEMFVRMQNRNVPFNVNLPNDPSNATRYVTQYQQAVNMGVYASDMAYCCIVGSSQNTLEYFNLVKNLSVEIGLYESINKDLVDRILDNLTETDTLISVTSDSYHEVVTYIEDQGLADIHCLVVASAWIESLYLCLEPMKHMELNDDDMELIQDHQVLLENLIELLAQNKQSGNVSKLLEELQLIQAAYDVTYQNESESLTQQQFANIVNTVADVRARLVL